MLDLDSQTKRWVEKWMDMEIAGAQRVDTVYIVGHARPMVAFADETLAKDYARSIVATNEEPMPITPLKLWTEAPKMATRFTKYIGVKMDGNVAIERMTADIVYETYEDFANLKPLISSKTQMVRGFSQTYSWSIRASGTDENKVRASADKRLATLQAKIRAKQKRR